MHSFILIFFLLQALFFLKKTLKQLLIKKIKAKQKINILDVHL
jgi:hypothetical protein